MSGPQLWVGPEPTVNRVDDRYLDQSKATGFDARLDDIDRLASLGVTHVRFPLLWERTATHDIAQQQWAWADARMERMRALGLEPIVGLVHHGSGPPGTDLLDPAFPARLAAYARAVARRYPWVQAYTPVNEPLTTARFSALYGVWYPHRRDDRSFVRALMHEVQATALAMAAVRSVNPAAQLVQTEDLGYTSGTPPLQYQVEFDNERRWLAFDLLLGRVDREHPLYRYVRANGASEQELEALRAAPCAPDVFGINSYVTSERFLDDRLHRYPPHLHGGNGQHRYADTEAVRVLGHGIGGFRARLAETWQRYRAPMAITEVHLGCTREEQMRWLMEAWQAARAVRAEGVDVRAITAWAAFGSSDWDSLLREQRGHYEPGLWDVRAPEPRPTALASMVRELAHGVAPTHPVLAAPGWWRRQLRLVHPLHGEMQDVRELGRPVLITGATGTLGQAFARICHQRGLPYRLTTRQELDICDAASISRAIDRWQPWAIVNAAGYVRVDDAETDPRQWDENATGPALLAQACERADVRLLTFSSDLVFDGEAGQPYTELDEPRPLNAYGRAKQQAEQRVLACCPAALVVRTSAFFSPWDRYNFLTLGLQALRAGGAWEACEDQTVSPTYVPDLVHASLDLLIDDEAGLWHLANRGEVTWAELARCAARLAGLPVDGVQGVASQGDQAARRPAYSALDSVRGWVMPPLDDALRRYVAEQVLPAPVPASSHGCVDHGAVGEQAGSLAGLPQRAEAARTRSTGM
nr:family 1 glycosylhydrolase [uncultured Caldimonas sp.]